MDDVSHNIRLIFDGLFPFKQISFAGETSKMFLNTHYRHRYICTIFQSFRTFAHKKHHDRKPLSVAKVTLGEIIVFW